MWQIPASLWFCMEGFTRRGPTETGEGLKIDESSQNHFIASEVLAYVMSGKIVLLLWLIEVHDSGTALKCLTIKVRVPPPHPRLSLSLSVR